MARTASTPALIANVDTDRNGAPLRISPRRGERDPARFEATFTVEDGGKFYRVTVFDHGALEAGFVFRDGRRLPDGHKRNVQAAACEAYRVAFHGTAEAGTAAAAARFARFRSRRPLGDYTVGNVCADHGSAYAAAYLMQWDRLAAEYDAAEVARLDGYARDAETSHLRMRARFVLAVDLGVQHDTHAAVFYATRWWHHDRHSDRLAALSYGFDFTTGAVVALVTQELTRLSRIRRQNGIGELIAKARSRGAVVRFTIDAQARRDEGRSLLKTITVQGLPGVGPYPMSVLGAVERLSAALA